MLTLPGSPIPQSVRNRPENPKARRAAQVIALGLMNRAQGCQSTGASDGSGASPVVMPVQPNPSLLSVDSMPLFFPTPLNLYTGDGVGAGAYGPGIDSTVPLPVAAQIYQSQQGNKAGLNQTATMDPASTDQAGQGATFSPSDFSDAPQVVPMNVTQEMAIQRNPQALAIRKRHKSPMQTKSPGVQWGGIPTGGGARGCGNAQLSPLAILLIAAGLGVIVYAVAAKR